MNLDDLRAEAFDPTSVVADNATTAPMCRFCNNTGVIGFGSFEDTCHECESANHEPNTMTPIMRRERVMRLALEMILAQCNCYTEHRAHIVDPIRRTAQQALRECGN